MATKKEITIISHHNEHEHEYTGTLEYLCNQVFGYTLECGHSWNYRIPRFPKGPKSLVKALNDSARECNHYSDYYELA